MRNERTLSIQRLHPIERKFVDETVLQCSWSSATDTVAIITADGKLHVATVQTFKKPISILAHASGALRVAWSPDGNLIATTGQDGALRIWRPDDLGLVVEHKLGAHWVGELAWLSGEVVAAGVGKHLFVVGVGKPTVREIASFENTITGIAWRSEQELVITTYGKALRLNVAREGEDVVGRFEYPEAMLLLKLSPDRQFAAIGCQDSAARVWTVSEDNDAVQMSGQQEKVQVLSWSVDSEHLAMSGGAEISVWSFAGSGPRDTKPIQLQGHRDIVVAANFAPKGKRLASVDKSGVLCVWDITRSTETPVAAGRNKSTIYTVEWSADGNYLITGDQDGSAALWNVSRV